MGDLPFSAGGESVGAVVPSWRVTWCLVVQVRSSVMCTPRNLVLLTLSTVELSMVSGRWSVEFLLLKSITTSFVFSHLGTDCWRTPFSQLCHFLSVVCFIVVADETYHCVSSANLMMWLELNLAVQSWVSSVKSSGLSTQPCGAPVLSVVVLEVLWPTRTD